MSTERAIVRAHRASLRNVRRSDSRMRLVFVAGSLIGLAVGLWSITWLVARVQLWQAAGTTAIAANLWLVCLSVWAACAFLTILALRQHGFASDEALLLFTLPIPPAARFRALCGLIVVEELVKWLLLTATIFAAGLGITLGSAALIWIVLALGGALIAAWCAIIVTLVVVRAFVRHRQGFRRVGLVLLIGLLVAATVLLTRVVVAFSPGLAAGAVLPVLLVLLGPAAGWAGMLYERSFQGVQSRSQTRTVLRMPGVSPLVGLLARTRTPTAALLTRGVLRQSRSWLTWVRAGAVGLYLLPFPWARAAATPHAVSDVQVIVGYVALLFMLIMIDSAASPVGGEGNRLALYITAPISGAAFLRAKLLVQLLPLLAGGLLVTSMLSWWVSLGMLAYGSALALVALIIIGVTALFVYGSVWDADLALEVIGAMQALVLEETPVTPRRIVLVSAGLLLIVCKLLLVWMLPAWAALLTLALLDGVLVLALQRFGAAQWRRLSQSE